MVNGSLWVGVIKWSWCWAQHNSILPPNVRHCSGAPDIPKPGKSLARSPDHGSIVNSSTPWLKAFLIAASVKPDMETIDLWVIDRMSLSFAHSPSTGITSNFRFSSFTSIALKARRTPSPSSTVTVTSTSRFFPAASSNTILPMVTSTADGFRRRQQSATRYWVNIGVSMFSPWLGPLLILMAIVWGHSAIQQSVRCRWAFLAHLNPSRLLRDGSSGQARG